MNKESFLKIVKDLDTSSLAQGDLLFCEFYLRCRDDVRTRLFDNFQDIVNKIVRMNKMIEDLKKQNKKENKT